MGVGMVRGAAGPGKSSTNPANGGEKIYHDAGLEREIDIMSEKALQRKK